MAGLLALRGRLGQAAALPALGTAAMAGCLRQLHGSAFAAKTERGPFQTGSQADAKQPFVEGDSLAAKRTMRDAYQDILKEKSGTAEDVGVLDQKQSSLGRMMADPRDVEQEYAQRGRDSVVSHGGRERESEDEAVADAVFDQKRADGGFEESAAGQEGHAEKPWDAAYAKKP